MARKKKDPDPSIGDQLASILQGYQDRIAALEALVGAGTQIDGATQIKAGSITSDRSAAATGSSTTYPSDAAHVPSIAVNGQGQITSATSTAIAIDVSQVANAATTSTAVLLAGTQTVTGAKTFTGGISPLLPGCVNLVITNDGVTPLSKVYLTADYAVAWNTSYLGIATSALVYRCDITASGAGGLDTGSVAASTWYHLWLISNGTTWNLLFSLSATSPTMPSGYTYKVRLGAWRTDGSSHLQPQLQIANECFTAPQSVFTSQAGNASYTNQDLSTFVPSTARGARGIMGHNFNANIVPIQMEIAADANGTGACLYSGQIQSAVTGSILNTLTVAVPWEIPIVNAQTLYWRAGYTGLAVWCCLVTGWSY